MTLNELKEFLNEKAHIRKADMRSARATLEVAKEQGLIVTRLEGDQYAVEEDSSMIIKDFSKPLIIDRTSRKGFGDEDDQDFMFNGIDVISVVYHYMISQYSLYLWAYLANKQDGDTIDFDYFYNKHCRRSEKTEAVLAREFDELKWRGFLEETDTNIIFHVYPSLEHESRPTWWFSNPEIRFAPVKK